MKPNADNCHLPLNCGKLMKMKIGNETIISSKCKKLLAIKIGNRASFSMHFTTDMTVSKKFMVMNASFRLQFSYSPLSWMHHCRLRSIRINRLHERWFCVIYNDKHSTFQTILDQDKSVSLHSCNLKGTPLGILADIFNSRRSTNYSLYY